MSEFIVCLHGDKSITHRAFIFAALASGKSIIRNVGSGEDLASTRRVLRQMGVGIEALSNNTWQVQGLGGIHNFHCNQESLDCGNSGTTMRLLAGLFSGLKQMVTLDGDASLRRRPMRRLARVLEPFGRTVQCAENGSAPIQVGGELNQNANEQPNDQNITILTASGSAQLKSAALLAGLSDHRSVRIIEEAQSRDHSERMLGALWSKSLIKSALTLELPASKPSFTPFDFVSPGDLSSAGFWVAVAVLADSKYSSIKLEGVNLNPSRMGLIKLAQQMGVQIKIEHTAEALGEPVGSILIKALDPSQSLNPIQPNAQEVLDALDELPLLALLACFADGRTEIRHAQELRVKESDRLEAMGQALASLGAQIETLADGWVINGNPNLIFQVTDELNSYGDHRIAMCLLIAQLKCIKGTELKINDLECIAVSYPEFPQQLVAYSR